MVGIGKGIEIGLEVEWWWLLVYCVVRLYYVEKVYCVDKVCCVLTVCYIERMCGYTLHSTYHRSARGAKAAPRRRASIATVRHAWVEERMGEELNERV